MLTCREQAGADGTLGEKEAFRNEVGRILWTPIRRHELISRALLRLRLPPCQRGLLVPQREPAGQQKASSYQIFLQLEQNTAPS